MYLIFQGTRVQVQVLKPCKSVQETSEEGLFIKVGQIPDSCSIDTIYRGLDSCSIDTIYRGLDSYLIDVSIENYEIIIFRSDSQPMLTCICRVSFLTTLDIYKTYFKICHIRDYKENK